MTFCCFRVALEVVTEPGLDHLMDEPSGTQRPWRMGSFSTPVGSEESNFSRPEPWAPTKGVVYTLSLLYLGHSWQGLLLVVLGGKPGMALGPGLGFPCQIGRPPKNTDFPYQGDLELFSISSEKLQYQT